MTSPNCSSGCKTGPHSTYGECIRSKGLKIAYSGIGGGDATVQKRWDAELDSYRSAVAQGIEPESTNTRDIRAAVEWSDRHGKAYTEQTAHDANVAKILEKVD